MNVLFKKYTLKDYYETCYNDAKREDAKNLLSLNVDEDIIKKSLI